MPKIILISLFFLIFLSSPVKSQTTEENTIAGIDLIYHLKFDSAESKFRDIIKADSRNPAGYFFLAMIDWWKININKENQSLDDVFFGKVEKVIEVADERLDKNENDDNAMFYKGGALGYRGLVKGLRESWLKAAEDGREAINLLQKANEINMNNKDVLFGVGLYNYFAEYIPETYPVVKPLMIIFPKGDKVKGLSQIKETLNGSKYAKTEAKYVLAYLNVIYEKNYYEAELYAKSLTEEFPENPVFEKYLGNSYVGQGKWNEALSVWKSVIEKIDSNKTGYGSVFLKRESNYYTALCYLKLNSILEAEPYIEKALDITQKIDKENNDAYTSYIYLICGMLNDVKGNKSTAGVFYDKVLSMKNYQNSHQEAERFKKDGYKQF
ncbi:MAG: hypothetical protein JST15_10635 [Bacteroidetes bacterium]|nr:hypothetical protein [Bacteroidota bacterium]